jgi:hypothetical protein
MQKIWAFADLYLEIVAFDVVQTLFSKFLCFKRLSLLVELKTKLVGRLPEMPLLARFQGQTPRMLFARPNV